MYQAGMKFDFHALGQEIRRKRVEKGWTQEYLGQLVDRSNRSIMYFENRGKHPSLDVLYRLVTILDISVDQFFFPAEQADGYDYRKELMRVTNDMSEQELAALLGAANGMKRARK